MKFEDVRDSRVFLLRDIVGFVRGMLGARVVFSYVQVGMVFRFIQFSGFASGVSLTHVVTGGVEFSYL